MKKAMKITSIVLMVMMLILTLNSVVMAKDSKADAGNIIDQMGTSGDISGSTGGITTVGGQIVSIITTVGIVLAVVVLVILGIKYMIGSASEKAEYKKTMIPYLVGAVLIFAASSIAKAIFAIANGISFTG